VQTAGVCEVRYLDNYAERRVQQLYPNLRPSHNNCAALQGTHVTCITKTVVAEIFHNDQNPKMLKQMLVLHPARAQPSHDTATQCTSHSYKIALSTHTAHVFATV
jgi:hypothetical protein